MADPLNEFEVLNKLGSGAFSSVYKVRRKTDGMCYALKRVPLAQLPEQEKQNALNEVRILASIRHANIVGYRQSFIDASSNTLCIVMEYADQGDLLNHIGQHVKEGTYLKEEKIWSILIQVLRGLGALHELGVQHRDLKSANILLNSDGRVQITDFNVSKICKHNNLSYTQTGTPYYASPEVWLEIPRDTKADIWSLGCILYEMCSLKPPFKAPDMKALSNKITKGVYSRIPSFYSVILSNILNSMLQINPQSRPSCNEILESDLMHMTISKYCPQDQDNDQHSILLSTIEFPTQQADYKLVLPATNYSKNLPAFKVNNLNPPQYTKKLNISPKSHEQTTCDKVNSSKSIDSSQVPANSTLVKKQYYFNSSNHDTSKETILLREPNKSIVLKSTNQINDDVNLINNNRSVIVSKVSQKQNGALQQKQKKYDVENASNRNSSHSQQQNNSICLSNLDISLDLPQIVRNSQSVRNKESKMISLDQNNHYFKRAARNIRKNSNIITSDTEDTNNTVSLSPNQQDLSQNSPLSQKIVMISRKKRSIGIEQHCDNHAIPSQLPLSSASSSQIADRPFVQPKSESRQQKQLSDYLNQYEPSPALLDNTNINPELLAPNKKANSRISNLSNIIATKSSVGQRNYTEINKQRQQLRLRSQQDRVNGQNEYTKRDSSAQELQRESASMGVNITCKKRIEQLKQSRSMTVSNDQKSIINCQKSKDIHNELTSKEYTNNNSNRNQSRLLDHCISLLDSSLQEEEALGLAKLLRKDQKCANNNNNNNYNKIIIQRPKATSSHSNHQQQQQQQQQQDQLSNQQSQGKRHLTIERPIFLPQIISKTQSTRGQYETVQRSSPSRFEESEIIERKRIKTDATTGHNSQTISVSQIQYRKKTETETKNMIRQKNICQQLQLDMSAQVIDEENKSVYQQEYDECADEKDSLSKIQKKQYSPRRFRF